jgi:hypothetical protein
MHDQDAIVASAVYVVMKQLSQPREETEWQWWQREIFKRATNTAEATSYATCG